jgi:hypothetical protein
VNAEVLEARHNIEQEAVLNEFVTKWVVNERLQSKRSLMVKLTAYYIFGRGRGLSGPDTLEPKETLIFLARAESA